MLTEKEITRFENLINFSTKKSPISMFFNQFGGKVTTTSADNYFSKFTDQSLERIIKCINTSIDSVQQAFKVTFRKNFSANVKVGRRVCKLYLCLVEHSHSEKPGNLGLCVSIVYKTPENQLANLFAQLSEYSNDNVYTFDYMYYTFDSRNGSGGIFNADDQQLYIKNGKLIICDNRMMGLEDFVPETYFSIFHNYSIALSYAKKFGPAFKKAVIYEIKN